MSRVVDCRRYLQYNSIQLKNLEYGYYEYSKYNEIKYKTIQNYSMGFFLFCLFLKVRAWSLKKYIFAMAALIIGIETFQLFFMCGFCDIDDFLLNLSGACLGFGVTRQGRFRAVPAAEIFYKLPLDSDTMSRFILPYRR